MTNHVSARDPLTFVSVAVILLLTLVINLLGSAVLGSVVQGVEVDRPRSVRFINHVTGFHHSPHTPPASK